MPSMFGTTRLASFAPEANDAETKLTRLDNRIGVIGRPLTMPAATNILNVDTLFGLLSITFHTQPHFGADCGEEDKLVDKEAINR